VALVLDGLPADRKMLHSSNSETDDDKKDNQFWLVRPASLLPLVDDL
jgi:hypothetical protein